MTYRWEGTSRWSKKGDFSLDMFGSFTFWLIVLAILLIILGIYLAPKLLDLANSSVDLW